MPHIESIEGQVVIRRGALVDQVYLLDFDEDIDILSGTMMGFNKKNVRITIEEI